MGGIMLKAKVRLECPRCGITLSCYARTVNSNNATWAFTHESHKHLTEASCEPPKLVLIKIDSKLEVAA
jgi:hypothetical protein